MKAWEHANEAWVRQLHRDGYISGWGIGQVSGAHTNGRRFGHTGIFAETPNEVPTEPATIREPSMSELSDMVDGLANEKESL